MLNAPILSVQYLFDPVRLTLWLAMVVTTLGYGFTQDVSDDLKGHPETISGAPSEVVLYRETAIVTRVIPLPAGKGPREVVIDSLPEALVTSSVFAEGNLLLAIRAVRVSQSPVADSARAEVRQLADELSQVQNEIQATEARLTVAQSSLRSLEEMIHFSSQASREDLGHGVLDAQALTELINFSEERRGDLGKQIHELTGTMQKLSDDRRLIERRLAEVSNGSPQTRYQARLFLDLLDDQATSLRLSYAVTGCSWKPQYTVSGSVDTKKFRVRYGALVQQLSGESWNGVNLTLSTASPSVSAAGPTLTPLSITAVDSNRIAQQSPVDDLFDSPNDAMQMQMEMGPSANSSLGASKSGVSGKIQSLRRKQLQVENQDFGSDTKQTPQSRDIALNTLAGEIQQLEFQANTKGGLGLATDAADEVASQTYQLSQKVSLDTRRDQQFVEIVDANLGGDFYHVATPLLSSFAYREADLLNDLKIGLLGGDGAVYLDDKFVGNTVLPTTASGQRLTVGFGADGQVRTRRELLEKKDSVQGGNRRLEFNYRLVVSNFKDSDVTLRVLDRMPITNQSQQINVMLSPPKLPLSEDKLYQRVLRPLGILRWDVSIPSSRFGSDAFDIEYNYSIEFDRNRTLSVPDGSDQASQGMRDLSVPSMGGGFGADSP